MNRESGNEYHDGKLVNGFDYERQVWIVNGVVQMCGHPVSMRLSRWCCNAAKLVAEAR